MFSQQTDRSVCGRTFMTRADRPCISIQDIAQGEAGDCWFLSSLCSWATYVNDDKKPEKKIMLDKVICGM